MQPIEQIVPDEPVFRALRYTRSSREATAPLHVVVQGFECSLQGTLLSLEKCI